MGSYTQNYNLYKPSIGETNWGNAVNNNFDIIDAKLKELFDKFSSLFTQIPGLSVEMCFLTMVVEVIIPSEVEFQ